MVFANSKKKDWNLLPLAVKNGLNHADAGKFIPKVALIDPESGNHLLSVRYEDWSEASKTMRRVKKSLKEIETQNSLSEEETKSTDTAYHEWSNFEGKRMTAQFIKLDQEFLVLKMSSGKEVNYPLDKLSEASQELAASLSEGL